MTDNINTQDWKTLLAQAQAANPQPHNRFAQLATLRGGAEPRPAVRTVAVRFFLEDGRLMISTDTRSEKVQELAANPVCELCWYFTETREQFRISARAHVVPAGIAQLDGRLAEVIQRTWLERSANARQSYTWPQPLRKRDEQSAYAASVPDEIPDNFALLLLDIVTVDYLNIAEQPHQRCVFNKLGGQWRGRVVNP